jgi:hypothetical protein
MKLKEKSWKATKLTAFMIALLGCMTFVTGCWDSDDDDDVPAGVTWQLQANITGGPTIIETVTLPFADLTAVGDGMWNFVDGTTSIELEIYMGMVWIYAYDSSDGSEFYLYGNIDSATSMSGTFDLYVPPMEYYYGDWTIMRL